MSIVHKLIKGIVYVYEKVSYWDKEKKQPRSIWKLLGKLEEATGTIVSTARNPSTENVVIQHDTPLAATPSGNPRNQYPATTTKEIPSSNEGDAKPPKEKRGYTMPIRQKTTGQTEQVAREIVNVLNAPAINEVCRASKERMTVRETLTPDGLETVGAQWLGGVQVMLGNFNRLNLTDITRKLLDILRIKLTEKAPYSDIISDADIARVRSITITLDEYMELCGLSDRKRAREQLRANAYTLFNLSMKWDEEGYRLSPRGRKVRRKIHWDLRLFDSTMEERNLDSDPVIDSAVTFNFSYDMVRYLCQKYIMGYCKKALTIDVRRHPHALCMAHKLMEHYNMNCVKTEHVRITVASLMAACPALPTVEEVKGLHYTQLIREPFERDLLALKEIYCIVDWHYCRAGGEPLTDEQQADFSFDDWCTWRIEFTIPGYPSATERKEQRRAALISRRKKDRPRRPAIIEL